MIGSRGRKASSPATGPPLAGILLLSAAAIGYEVLLVRLLSIAEWHHVVSMVISLALLGYGVSGSVIAIAREPLAARYGQTFVLSALLFSLSAPTCYLLAQSLPFNALEILWDPRQWAWLALVYLTLSVPFFFVATCIALSLSVYTAVVGRVYAADLLGAGLGALTVLLVLSIMPPELGLRLTALLALVGAAIGTYGWRSAAVWPWRLLIAAAGVLILAFPTSALRPEISPYKGLAQALQVQGARLVSERSGAHALISVVANEEIPLRHAPGLSLQSPYLPADQLSVFANGEGPTAVDHFSGEYEQIRYLDWTPGALAYRLHPQPERVLILGQQMPGGLLAAVLNGATHVDALAIDPALIALLTRELADFNGWRHLASAVDLHHATARGFLARERTPYDVIRLDLGGSGEGGAGALRQDYAATIEGIGAMWERLTADGLIAIGSDIEIPPRLPLKLLATAIRSLEAAGVEQPAAHLAMLRAWGSAELIITAAPLGPERIAALREFAQSRGFDLGWYPGMAFREANRYQRLDRPWLHEGAIALLGPERDAFLRQYKFDLAPATDDRPYVFNSFRWAVVPELLRLREQGGSGLLEMGYPLLVATLLQAVVLSLLLILAPLSGLRPQPARDAGPLGRWRVLVYFFAIGLAFMFIEIAFIQRFVLFLGDPVWATAVVVSGFLVFAGIGSLTSGYLRSAVGPGGLKMLAVTSVAGIVLVATSYLLVLPVFGADIARLPLPARLGLAYALVAPLAFAMGMPFPLGLASTAYWHERLIPWAWAINGCASVTGALIAALIGVGHGFATVMIAAGSLYLLATLVFPAPPRRLVAASHPRRPYQGPQ